jgi:glycosyltransferase involved in cell wall biosynthesis
MQPTGNSVYANSRETIAIVVQRYGAEINGGAEVHARVLAHRLREKYDVEILTTCAVDTRKWGMAYKPETYDDAGVCVHRFAHEPRGSLFARHTPLRVRMRVLRARVNGGVASEIPPGSFSILKSERKWLVAQGPTSPELVDYLVENLRRYRVVLIFSLRYCTAVDALEAAGSKALLIPTLHDEKAMYRSIYRHALELPSNVLFNTTAERAFAGQLYGQTATRGQVVGLGIDITSISIETIKNVMAKYGITSSYAIYAGRINRAKGCDLLFDAFEKFSERRQDALKLVCLGRVDMPLPAENWLIAPGFVPDADRDALVAGAIAFLMPSRFESLSLATLEAMASGTPVVVNAASAVLKDHVRNSGTGFTFANCADCVRALENVVALTNEERADLSARSRAYVKLHYSWDVILRQIEQAIDEVPHNGAAHA